ncbi:MAG TPA: phosphodiester glycosidase family protein [Solirubrobacterales bacterium]|nr:phosphodiester glycosidase family protein [Solirubrobacterales bacterium]
MPASTLPRRRNDASAPRLSRERRRLGDGLLTTLHVARFRRDAVTVSVANLEPCATLADWCAAERAPHAIVGGFYMRPGGPPLGDLWIDGEVLPTTAFDAPWDACRACVHVDAGAVTLRAREEIEGPPRGDLLQAGPMLVRDGELLVRPGVDVEGFSAGSCQFDSDITAGRYPRAAIGVDRDDLVAAVCDGRADDDAGMTMTELGEAMAALGCVDAMNLDGGGSASLVIDGALVNTPREEHGRELVGGREIATALRFSGR